MNAELLAGEKLVDDLERELRAAMATRSETMKRLDLEIRSLRERVAIAKYAVRVEEGRRRTQAVSRQTAGSVDGARVMVKPAGWNPLWPEEWLVLSTRARTVLRKGGLRTQADLRRLMEAWKAKGGRDGVDGLRKLPGAGTLVVGELLAWIDHKPEA